MNPRILVQLFHILIVGGLFLYAGIVQEKMAKYLFTIFFILGVGILGYHLFRAYIKMISEKPYWINLIHIFIVAPLLIYIGYYKENTSRRYFEMLLMLGFASIGYHGYYLIRGE